MCVADADGHNEILKYLVLESYKMVLLNPTKLGSVVGILELVIYNIISSSRILVTNYTS